MKTDQEKGVDFWSNFFLQNRPVGRVAYAEKRGVSFRFKLTSGKKYLVIPTTFEPNKHASYMLRLLISKNTEKDHATYASKHSEQEIEQAGLESDSSKLPILFVLR